MEILEQIKQLKIVPVVVLNSLEETLPKVGALVEGGLPVAEITFRTACAADAIALAAKTYPDALIGAGTVINKEQCEKAIKCGAKFIVSPGFSHEVLKVCNKRGVPYLPGVITPTEIMDAISSGLTTLKFFPASNFGGLKTIKALCSAFPQIRFMPTGGVNEENILEFLAFDKIIACGGSWMMKGTPEEIKEATKKAVELVNKK